MGEFSQRSTLPELMDQPGVAFSDIKTALRELEIINTWLGGYKPVLKGIKEFYQGETLRITDIGSGGGDVLRKIARWAGKSGIPVELCGIDMNPQMTEYSRQMSESNIRFITANAFELNKTKVSPDIIINTLFCHHFDNKQLVDLLQTIKNNCRKGFIINDLHRHPLAWSGIKILTTLFSRSYLVKYDGPLSVKRSLTRKEWKKILDEAGINNYSIRWFWAWRWQIIFKQTS